MFWDGLWVCSRLFFENILHNEFSISLLKENLVDLPFGYALFEFIYTAFIFIDHLKNQKSFTTILWLVGFISRILWWFYRRLKWLVDRILWWSIGLLWLQGFYEFYTFWFNLISLAILITTHNWWIILWMFTFLLTFCFCRLKSLHMQSYGLEFFNFIHLLLFWCRQSPPSIMLLYQFFCLLCEKFSESFDHFELVSTQNG